MLDRELERVAVACREQFILVVMAVVPDGADGVDDVPRREIVALGNPGLAGRTTAERLAFLDERLPAARWMAPSTPPPPSRLFLAALTMASTSSLVMSPSIISMRSLM